MSDNWRYKIYCPTETCSYSGRWGRADSKQEAIEVVESAMCRNSSHQRKPEYLAHIIEVNTGTEIPWTHFEPDLFTLMDN